MGGQADRRTWRGGLFCLLGLLCLLCLPCHRLSAQRPTVSAQLERQARTRTTLLVWLFARPETPLSAVRSAVTDAGGTVRHASTWLHAVSAEIPGAGLDRLRTLPELRHLQPVTVFVRPRPEIAAAPATPAPPALRTTASAFGPSAMPLRRLNAFPLIERGFRGAGVRIALLDTGFETGLPAFAGAQVIARRDFVFGDTVVADEANDTPTQSDHGTAVWSLLAADVPDTLVGLAPDATYLLAKTEDVRQEARVEEDHWVAALQWADSIGVDIVSTSLVYLTFDDGFGYQFNQLNGDIAVTTVAADAAASRGIVMVNAVGNGGPGSRSLRTPADGDSVIAVGAEDSTGVLAGFSSRGPTADGRIKPDVMAPGVDVLVLVPSGGGQAFGRVSGTSLATPLIAGGAALLHEVHGPIGPVAIRTALRSSGTNRAAPDTLVGWGRPDLFLSTVFPAGVTLTSPVLAPQAATPLVSWAAPGVAPFAGTPRYRLRVGGDTAFTTLILDTATTETAVVLPPLRPGATFALELTATAADSAVVVVRPDSLFAVPAWVTLATLNAPAGITVRDPRPLFEWTPAEVLSPFGPFSFDIEILREDNGTVVITDSGLTATSYRPPADLEFNTPYRWALTARLGAEAVRVASTGPFVVSQDSVPSVTTLFQNFPNPFPNLSIGQRTTCLWFDLAEEGVIRLEILDVRGHVVRTIFPNGSGAFLRAGRYGRPAGPGAAQCDQAFAWDGRADDGRMTPGGLYLAKLSTPSGAFFRRIVFLGENP